MAKPLTITGRTEILAAIYSPDYLPSAILEITNSNPWCLHSLRENDLSFFEKTFMSQLRQANGMSEDDASKDDELKVLLHRFFEDYHIQGHTCIGCHQGEKTEKHHIGESEEACRKTIEDCA